MIDLHQLSQLIIPVAHAAEEATTNGGIAGTFGIDWMKFVAQLVNFAIVLFVLWKWVFTPVTKKLEERTAKIEKAMKDAASTEKEKQEFAQWKDLEMVKVRSQASAIVAAAQNDAIKAKQMIVDETKQDQQKLVNQAKAQIESEKNKSLAEAKTELADLVTNAAEKILRKKLDVKTDQEYIKESLNDI